MRRSTIVCVLLACGVSLHAQPSREPQPDARRLQLGKDSLQIFVVRQGQQQQTGIIVDRMDTVRVDGELLLHRVYRRIDLVLGSGIDTLVDHFPELTLRRVHSQSEEGGTEMLAWRAGHLTGTVDQAAKPKLTIEKDAARPPYSRASFDLILRASPLAEGYSVAVPAYSARRGAQMLTAKVVASEVRPGFGDTWRVDADLAGLSVTYWIAKTSRRLVHQIIRAAPGTELVIAAVGSS
jgi:hypothetical protein